MEIKRMFVDSRIAGALAMPAAIVLLAAAISLHAMAPAYAQPTGKNAVCTKLIIGKDWVDKRAVWMTLQLSSGKTQFVSDGQLLCAW